MLETPVNTTTPRIIYFLFLANIVVPFLGLIGVIMAYVNKADAPEWLQTHYHFQIRTFWIGFALFFIGALLTVILLGYLLILFAVFWIIVRSAKGLKFLDAMEAHPNPTGLMLS